MKKQRINQRLLKLWIAALRSGEYKQASLALVQINDRERVAYCCLGVACDVVRVNDRKGHWAGACFVLDGKRSDAQLPDSVARLFGFTDEDGNLVNDPAIGTMYAMENRKKKRTIMSASNANDIKHFSFKKIANLLEKRFVV